MLTGKSSMKSLALAALILILGGVVVTPTSLAKIASNTIDPIATVAENGRRIVVTGPISNDQTQVDDLRVTITQRATGAVAEGRARIEGTTSVQQWTVTATVQGNKNFEPGPATAVALATSSLHGQVDDAHQWLVEITLVGE